MLYVRCHTRFVTQNPVSLVCVTCHYKRTVTCVILHTRTCKPVVTPIVLHTCCRTLEVTHMLLQAGSFTHA